ncbi:hypothetical protein NOVOSPHI9U_710007 [Novosphingobium sp. 9U]|nr:hypothetical protein NOVOSPHI9U_710007 [Novosphingobium sp. 9U]
MRRLISLTLMVLMGWLVNVDLLWPLIAAMAGVIGLMGTQAFIDHRAARTAALTTPARVADPR